LSLKLPLIRKVIKVIEWVGGSTIKSANEPASQPASQSVSQPVSRQPASQPGI